MQLLEDYCVNASHNCKQIVMSKVSQERTIFLCLVFDMSSMSFRRNYIYKLFPWTKGYVIHLYFLWALVFQKWKQLHSKLRETILFLKTLPFVFSLSQTRACAFNSFQFLFFLITRPSRWGIIKQQPGDFFKNSKLFIFIQIVCHEGTKLKTVRLLVVSSIWASKVRLRGFRVI